MKYLLTIYNSHGQIIGQTVYDCLEYQAVEQADALLANEAKAESVHVDLFDAKTCTLMRRKPVYEARLPF